MAVNEISIGELATFIGDGSTNASVRVVDVRESDEYISGHVPGALHAPLSSLPDFVDLFDTENMTYVICQAGGRSMRACEYLESLGKKVTNVAGGTGAWIAIGNPVTAGDQP
jgi:rhodanese-related sulfurtransferase